MSPAPLLEASALCMWRGERCLFRDLDVAVRGGEALHLRGPNGCGKTTLLRILGGLVTADDGALHVDGEAGRAGAAALRRRVAYLGHADGVKQELTVRENLRFACLLAGAAAPGDDTVLARVGIDDLAALQARVLSAGQRRRLALARVLAVPRAVWLLDEPFTALDGQGCALLAGLMAEAMAAGTAIVFSSHQASGLDPARVRVLDLGATPS